MRASDPLALAVLLFAPVPAAHAAAATGPDALPPLVVGVVGSGDQLALLFREVAGAAARTLKLGEVFEDGWVLTALNPTAATLTKAGTSRTVGLNPAGALADPSAQPGGATVIVLLTLEAAREKALAAQTETTVATRAAFAAGAATITDLLSAEEQLRIARNPAPN